MPTKLFLVRHGHTPEENRLGKHGPNEGLDSRGYKEATAVTRHFRDTDFDDIYCSQYRRAQITANDLRNTHYWKKYTVISDPIFNEISRYGVEDKKYTDWSARQYFDWRKNIIYYPTQENIHSRFMGKGESHWMFLERCGQIPEIFSLPQFSEKNIVVYTHSQLIVTVQTWLRYGSKPTPEQLMAPFRDRDNFPKCGSITELVFDDGFWTIAKSNYTDHLPK